jgi:hypothetical protein
MIPLFHLLYVLFFLSASKPITTVSAFLSHQTQRVSRFVAYEQGRLLLFPEQGRLKRRQSVRKAMAPPDIEGLGSPSPGDGTGGVAFNNADKGCRVVNKHAWVYDQKLELFLENLPKVRASHD